MGRQVLTPADRANIVRWSAEGLSDAQIATKLGGKCTDSAIFAFRTRAGVPSGYVRPPNALERGEHGIETAWNLGCKCGPCRAAHTARQKATMARLNRETAGGARQGQPWEPWEDDLLVAPRENGDLVALAKFLGRSYTACSQRIRRAKEKVRAREQGRGTLF